MDPWDFGGSYWIQRPWLTVPRHLDACRGFVKDNNLNRWVHCILLGLGNLVYCLDLAEENYLGRCNGSNESIESTMSCEG